MKYTRVIKQTINSETEKLSGGAKNRIDTKLM